MENYDIKRPMKFWIGIVKGNPEHVTWAFFPGDKPLSDPDIQWILVKEEETHTA
jgi:hypothetical protein